MELFAADGHDAGGCERVTGKSGMRPVAVDVLDERSPLPEPADGLRGRVIVDREMLSNSLESKSSIM